MIGPLSHVYSTPQEPRLSLIHQVIRSVLSVGKNQVFVAHMRRIDEPRFRPIQTQTTILLFTGTISLYAFCFASSAIIHDPAQPMRFKQDARKPWNGRNNVTRHALNLVRTPGTLALLCCSMLLMVRIARRRSSNFLMYSLRRFLIRQRSFR